MRRLRRPLVWLRDWAEVKDLEQRLQAVIDRQREGGIKDPCVRHALILQRESFSQVLAAKRAAYCANYCAPGERSTFEVA